ncbi:undecaprenyl/decaprenyl-phosphate alpha-N-acetylglucosaminyl 1-phosphate transferase [Candidatus Pelagibacter sp.]|nr:undecaprenyl/decaprenyl-phosphate alpha-N-acetylglucosaminyl 1-phosphate transferase [Candidatus Pelagibacter sp.]
MSNIILFLIVILVIIIFNFFGKKIGYHLGIIDKPTKGKIHEIETPLIGGFPLFFFSIFFLIFNFNFNYDLSIIILFSTCFFFLGYIDDKLNINAYLKLFISALIFFVILSLYDSFPIQRIYIEQFDKVIVLKKLSIPFTILCLLLLLNAVNLSDGINGLTSGLTAIWLFVLILLSSDYVQIYCIFLLILVLFNTFNIIRGKYFLGDSGTLLLGCLIGLITIFNYNLNYKSGIILSVEKIFILFMVPGIDMFRLFVIRLLKKKDPFTRDLDHLHHILLKRFNLGTTLIIYYTFVVVTIGLSLTELIQPLYIILSYLIIYILFIFNYRKYFKKTS